MRPRSRLPPALLLSAALLTAVATAIASCTDAVGIEQCRTIETARCQSAAHCGFSEDEVLRCTEFYHDQCLHGIENASEPPDDSDAKLCVDAIHVVAGCAQKAAASMADCPQAPLLAGTDPALTPCTVILKSAHLLQACAFVSKHDTGSTPTPDSGSGDAADSGDSAGD